MHINYKHLLNSKIYLLIHLLILFLFKKVNKYLNLLLLIIPFSLFGQGETNNWYFGNKAGVNFNTSPPLALTNAEINTIEGSSSISDASGNLLFYTDGRTVWDREHNIMPNADYFGGTGLLGDPSSTMSALIIPHPGQPNLYFIFTVDEPHKENANAYPNQGPVDNNGFPLPFYDERVNLTVPEADDGFNNGLNYSLVDMSLRNGLGDVVADNKNMHLRTYQEENPEQLKYKCSEKVTAVAGADCNTIWVITHFVEWFYAFFIDENGINEEPVESKHPPAIGLEYYGEAASGILKASPNGEKLAMATTQTIPPLAISGFVNIYDFDNLTGEVNNPIEILTNMRPYGIEFSPNSQKVFATIGNDIAQWDLNVGNPAGSVFLLNTGENQLSLQFGPDGKIYSASGTKLNVINNPNAYGENMNYSSSFLEGAIDLNGNNANVGLPNFLQSILNTRVDIVDGDGIGNSTVQNTISICDGETYILGYEYPEAANYQWHENGEPILGETSPYLTISLPANEQAPFTTAYTLDIFPESGDCKLSGLANTIFGEAPEIANASLSQCASGSSFFNFNNAREELIAPSALEVNDFEYAYFETTEDLLNNNSIQNISNYENLTNPQSIIVEVTSKETRCSSIVDLQLNVINNEIEETLEVELTECDTNLDGFQEFNLELVAEQTNLNPTNFYLKIKDALEDRNRITNITEFSNTEAYSQTIYFRVLVNGSCNVLGVLTLRVQDLPFTFEDKKVYYCIEDTPDPITIFPSVPENEVDNYEYFWTATNQEGYVIEVNEAAIYQVLVTEIASGCVSTQNISVVNTSTANFQVNVRDSNQKNNSIEVILDETFNTNNFEYSLNSPTGVYQDSPVFSNLAPGKYEVYVRNKLGCGISKRTVYVVGAMLFFTPNNDGINDVWNLVGLPNNQNAEIYIFDRYGKLLIKFNAKNFPGWDGTYHGNLMPNNDYWFRANLDNGRIIKGNFTLKR